MDDLFTLTQAAEYLDVTRQSIHILLKNGKLEGRRLGSMWVFTRAALDAYKVMPRHAGGRPKIDAGTLTQLSPA